VYNCTSKQKTVAAGYSTTPLAKKLGMKEGSKVRLINAPAHYFNLFTDLPKIEIIDDKKQPKDLIHFFAGDSKQLNELLPKLRDEINSGGMIWVSWPKKSAKVTTDVSENMIREIALANGLVDIKVCAVDETWSGLKLVIPVKERK
jgi:hypothetical protein